MPNFTAGTSFTDGVTNDVTAAKLNALIADAVPTSSLSLNSTTGTISQFSSGTGTAASPAIQPTGDTNTGIFFPAADTIAFSEGGTEAMRIDSSGRVGIGTSSPAYSLEVAVGTSGQQSIANFRTADSTATNNAGIQIFATPSSTAASRNVKLVFDSDGANASGGDYFIITKDGNSGAVSLDQQSNSAMTFNTNATERLRIDSSGNVGIGVTSPQSKFHVASTSCEVILQDSDTVRASNLASVLSFYGSDARAGYIGYPADSNMYINQINSGAILFLTNNTERFRIDSSGNLCIGHSNSTGLINGAWKTMIEGSNCLSVKNTNTSGATTAGFGASNYSGPVNIINFYRGDGTTLVGTISMTNGSSGTTVAYNTSSDYRLKTNLEPISNGIERVKQLPVYRFNWIEDKSGNKVDGFVAHEAQAIVPECVTGEKDAVDADGKPIYQGIDQSKIVPLLTAALKEAIAKIETLEAKVTALEAV